MVTEITKSSRRSSSRSSISSGNIVYMMDLQNVSSKQALECWCRRHRLHHHHQHRSKEMLLALQTRATDAGPSQSVMWRAEVQMMADNASRKIRSTHLGGAELSTTAGIYIATLERQVRGQPIRNSVTMAVANGQLGKHMTSSNRSSSSSSSSSSN